MEIKIKKENRQDNIRTKLVKKCFAQSRILFDSEIISQAELIQAVYFYRTNINRASTENVRRAYSKFRNLRTEMPQSKEVEL
jgi:hypothetical protein